MAKIKENWLSILLAVVVILSMIFSALLWTNSLGYEWIANNDSEKGASQRTALQSVGDIYLPTQVILTNSDESQKLLYGQKKESGADAAQGDAKMAAGWFPPRCSQ